MFAIDFGKGWGEVPDKGTQIILLFGVMLFIVFSLWTTPKTLTSDTPATRSFRWKIQKNTKHFFSALRTPMYAHIYHNNANMYFLYCKPDKNHAFPQK